MKQILFIGICLFILSCNKDKAKTVVVDNASTVKTDTTFSGKYILKEDLTAKKASNEQRFLKFNKNGYVYVEMSLIRINKHSDLLAGMFGAGLTEAYKNIMPVPVSNYYKYSILDKTAYIDLGSNGYWGIDISNKNTLKEVERDIFVWEKEK